MNPGAAKHFLREFDSEITEVSRLFLLNYGLTELIHLHIKITEVSVFFTDGWQHC